MNYASDLSLLDVWADAKNHVKHPMIATFEFDGKRLIYVGTRHNYKHSPAPESFYAINYCFDNFNIDCIVTECAHNRTVKDWEQSLGSPDMNELVYAPFIGRRKNIPYIFADSSDQECFSDVVRTDINAIKDMQTFFMIGDAHRYKKCFGKPDTIQHAINNVVHKFWRDSYPAPMDASEFVEYGKQQFGIDINDDNLSDLLSAHPEWNAPDKDGNPINRAHAYIDLYSRDPRMLKAMFDAANKHNCVLVTSGAGHFDDQKRVLAAAFGTPKIIYDFPATPRRDLNYSQV